MFDLNIELVLIYALKGCYTCEQIKYMNFEYQYNGCGLFKLWEADKKDWTKVGILTKIIVLEKLSTMNWEMKEFLSRVSSH